MVAPALPPRHSRPEYGCSLPAGTLRSASCGIGVGAAGSTIRLLAAAPADAEEPHRKRDRAQRADRALLVQVLDRLVARHPAAQRRPRLVGAEQPRQSVVIDHPAAIDETASRRSTGTRTTAARRRARSRRRTACRRSCWRRPETGCSSRECGHESAMAPDEMSACPRSLPQQAATRDLGATAGAEARALGQFVAALMAERSGGRSRGFGRLRPRPAASAAPAAGPGSRSRCSGRRSGCGRRSLTATLRRLATGPSPCIASFIICGSIMPIPAPMPTPRPAPTPLPVSPPDCCAASPIALAALNLRYCVHVADRRHAGALVDHLLYLFRRRDGAEEEIDQLDAVLGEVVADPGLEAHAKLVVDLGQLEDRAQVLAEQIRQPRDDDILEVAPRRRRWCTAPGCQPLVLTNSCGLLMRTANLPKARSRTMASSWSR